VIREVLAYVGLLNPGGDDFDITRASYAWLTRGEPAPPSLGEMQRDPAHVLWLFAEAEAGVTARLEADEIRSHSKSKKSEPLRVEVGATPSPSRSHSESASPPPAETAPKEVKKERTPPAPPRWGGGGGRSPHQPGPSPAPGQRRAVVAGPARGRPPAHRRRLAQRRRRLLDPGRPQPQRPDRAPGHQGQGPARHRAPTAGPRQGVSRYRIHAGRSGLRARRAQRLLGRCRREGRGLAAVPDLPSGAAGEAGSTRSEAGDVEGLDTHTWRTRRRLGRLGLSKTHWRRRRRT